MYTKHPFNYSGEHLNIDEISDSKIIVNKIESAEVIQLGLFNWEHPAYRLFDIDLKTILKGKKVVFTSNCSPFIYDPGKTIALIKRHHAYIYPHIYEEIKLYQYQNINQLNLPFPVLNNFLIENKNLTPNRKASVDIVLFHSSTAPYIKNSRSFLQAADNLSLKYSDVTTVYNQGVENSENLKNMLNADVVFDEMWVMSLWGQSGIEAAALGKPVICYLAQDSQDYWKEVTQIDKLPFIIATPETIEEKLIELIVNVDLRQAYGQRSKEWFWEHWSSPSTAKRLHTAFQEMECFT